jgi:hypothetical protein
MQRLLGFGQDAAGVVFFIASTLNRPEPKAVTYRSPPAMVRFSELVRLPSMTTALPIQAATRRSSAGYPSAAAMRCDGPPSPACDAFLRNIIDSVFPCRWVGASQRRPAAFRSGRDNMRNRGVNVEGALFSVGDTHAAQGDGEVCGTAIESPMRVALRFELLKDTPLATPRFTTPGPVSRHLDAQGYEVTTGIGPDLMAAAKDSVRRMIELLGASHGLTPAEAYMLCSVCGDLRISEIVDAPNWVVSFYFPRVVMA